jgi:hypothetical protein
MCENGNQAQVKRQFCTEDSGVQTPMTSSASGYAASVQCRNRNCSPNRPLGCFVFVVCERPELCDNPTMDLDFSNLHALSCTEISLSLFGGWRFVMGISQKGKTSGD